MSTTAVWTAEIAQLRAFLARQGLLEAYEADCRVRELTTTVRARAHDDRRRPRRPTLTASAVVRILRRLSDAALYRVEHLVRDELLARHGVVERRRVVRDA